MNPRSINSWVVSAALVAAAGVGTAVAQRPVEDMMRSPREWGLGSQPQYDACVSLTQASCHSTIQAAIVAASPGDEILIKNGVYVENVVVPVGKDGLTLLGQMEINTIIDGDAPNVGPTIQVMSSDVTIKFLTIRNGSDDGIKIAPGATGARIEHVSVKGAAGDCLEIKGNQTFIQWATLLGCGFQAIDIDAHDVTVDHTTMERAGRGCVELNGDRGTLTKNTLNTCDDGECIDIDGDDAYVNDNDLFNCAGDGIDVAGNNAQVILNVIETCDLEGIDVFGNTATINSNQIEACDSGGISVAGANPTLKFNVINRISGDDGFATGITVDCDPCTGGLLLTNKVDNVADDCPGYDLFASAPGLLVDLNDVNRAGGSGYELSGNGIDFRRNEAHRNGGDTGEAGIRIFGTAHVLDDNVSTHSHGDGIDVAGTNHVLTDNAVNDNLEDGIDVQASGVALTDNIVNDNAGVGIEISAGSANVTVTSNNADDNRVDYCDEGAATIRAGNVFTTEGVCSVDD